MGGAGLNRARHTPISLPMTLATQDTKTAGGRQAEIEREIDHAQQRGALQKVVVPPCPALLVRLRRALATAEPDLDEVAAVATSDVAMAATLLRWANGPMLAGLQPVQTVGQAMYRLGLERTAAVMTGFLARHAIPADTRSLPRFWERSGARGLAMGHIARQLPGLSVDVAHTFGLFSHVGMVVLMQGLPGYGGTLAEAAARFDRSFIETENANHRTDHAVVGALVARLWQLAPSVMTAIRLHHELEALGDKRVSAEVHTLVAAGLVAEQLVRRHEGLPPEREWHQHADAARLWLGVSADDVEHWQQELAPLFEAA